LFRGIDGFLLKIVKNQVILFDPISKKNQLNVAIYEVKLSNLEVATNFFKFFTDLTLKMKLKFEIYFFIKNENDKMLIHSNLAFIEKNHHRFLDLLEKFSSIKELRIMMEEVQVNKKRIIELFIRRLIDESFDFKIDEHLDFLSKHLLNQKINASEQIENANLGQNQPQLVDAFSALSIELPITGTISDAALNVFHESLNVSNMEGHYLDPEEYVFDDGTTVYILIHELNIKILLDLLKKNVMNRKFKLIFVDPEELAAFFQAMPFNKSGVLAVSSLEDFSSNIPPQYSAS